MTDTLALDGWAATVGTANMDHVAASVLTRYHPLYDTHMQCN